MTDNKSDQTHPPSPTKVLAELLSFQVSALLRLLEQAIQLLGQEIDKKLPEAVTPQIDLIRDTVRETRWSVGAISNSTYLDDEFGAVLVEFMTLLVELDSDLEAIDPSIMGGGASKTWFDEEGPQLLTKYLDALRECGRKVGLFGS